MKRLLAVATATVLALTGCGGGGSDDPAEGRATVAVTVDTSKTPCLPEGVPGNCWLPFYDAPVLVQNGALNASDTCNNQSRDQSACWPQPGEALQADCIEIGADKRPWYGFMLPWDRVLNPAARKDRPEGKPIRAYAAAAFLAVQSGNLGDLVDC